MKLLILIASAMLASNALAADCPSLSGTYLVKSVTSAENGTQTPPAGETLTITQTGCTGFKAEIAVPGDTDKQVQELTVDGAPHAWMGIADVGAYFSLTCHYEPNALVGVITMTGTGQNAGSVKYALDPATQTLTYSMGTLGDQGFQVIAVRQ